MIKLLLAASTLATLLLLQEGAMGLTLDILKTQAQGNPSPGLKLNLSIPLPPLVTSLLRGPSPPTPRDDNYCGEYGDNGCDYNQVCCGGSWEEQIPSGQCCDSNQYCNEAKSCFRPREICSFQHGMQGEDQCDQECKKRGYFAGCCVTGNDKSNSRPLVDIMTGGNSTYVCKNTVRYECHPHCDCCNLYQDCDRQEHHCYVHPY